MASEDLFQENFSEEVLSELDELHGNVGQEIKDTECDSDMNLPSTSGSNPLEEDHSEKPADTITNDNGEQHVKLFHLPLTRVRNLMKLDPDLHIASHEAVFVVTRATELFIQSLAREAYSYTAQAEKKTVQKHDVMSAINEVDSLMFLDGAMNV